MDRIQIAQYFPAKMAKYNIILYLLVRLFLASFFIFLLMAQKEKRSDTLKEKSDSKLDKLFQNWCRIRNERTEFKSKLKPCNFDISWNSSKDDDQRKSLSTDASTSIITEFNINPAGQFSSFILQSRTRDGKDKTIGGDSWRIMVRGRSTVVPTIFDLSNGQYEVIFLMADPGVYKISITLDYTLCDGYRDPPHDFFVKGDSQGKQQPNGMLKGRARKDYLMQKFQNGREILINIPLPKHEGFFFMHTERDIQQQFDPMCQSKCAFMWDGFGRWINDVWRPYLTDINRISKPKQFQTQRTNYSTLLVYGDSQADRMYQSLQNSAICTEIFKSCEVVKLWVYRFKKEKPPKDDLDFDAEKLISIIKEDLQNPAMDENSVVIINLGLHYLMGISFTRFQTLIKDVVDLLKSDIYKGKVIWKTTTSVSKEKDTYNLLFSDQKRFLNVPRIKLFNSFSTKSMCDAGFEVLDVFPITRGFPEGSGGPEIGFYKEHDIVHFKNYVLKPVDKFLEKYFRGEIPYPISFLNYKFL